MRVVRGPRRPVWIRLLDGGLRGINAEHNLAASYWRTIPVVPVFEGHLSENGVAFQPRSTTPLGASALGLVESDWQKTK